MTNSKTTLRDARKRRIRAKLLGTAERPRMSVYRSLTKMTVQLIDDAAGRTLVSASSTEAKDKKISTVVFDRNGYKYHGRVKELADAARAGGLQF